MLRKFVLVVLTLTLAPAVFSRTPWPANPNATNISLTGFESSGAVYDPSTDLIYVVDDQGSIASMTTEGQNKRYVEVEDGLDMEAVASTRRDSGFIYVGIEREQTCYFDIRSVKICDKNRAQIWQLEIETLQPTNRKWVLDMKTGITKGLEGLTWVANGDHPYGKRKAGGVFYASSQKNGHIYVYEINFDATPNDAHRLVRHIDEFEPFSGYLNNDISDLYFDPGQKILYVLYDKKNKLVEIDISNQSHRILENYDLPGESGKHEGITMVSSCDAGATSTTIYLTDDRNGKGIFSYPAFPISCSKNTSFTVNKSSVKSTTAVSR